VAAAEKLRVLLLEGRDVRAFDELTLFTALADDLFPLGNHARAEPSYSCHVYQQKM
jgi:hypothetical protein